MPPCVRPVCNAPVSLLQTAFLPAGDSSRSTRRHGLVERVYRERGRVTSPHRRPLLALDKNGRQISFLLGRWAAGSVLKEPPPESPLPSKPQALPPPAKSKTTLNINVRKPAPSPVKLAPPVVLPKPQSPTNIIPPKAKTPPTSGPLLVSPPPSIGKPISSLPMYAPVSSSRLTPPAPAPAPAPTLAPTVVLVSSLTPVIDGGPGPSGRSTPSGRMTPSGRRTPSGSLRQGVPQKPYTFMDEKAR